MKSAIESVRKAPKSRNFDVLHAFSVSADVLIFGSALEISFFLILKLYKIMITIMNHAINELEVNDPFETISQTNYSSLKLLNITIKLF
jgi:hypothetical protein